MRKIVTSCALCAVTLALSANAAWAAEAHAQAAHPDQGSAWIKTATAGSAEAGPLNATAARPAEVAVAQHKADPAPGQEHRRRTGPAMLIAALAVMTAIALRRLGASGL